MKARKKYKRSILICTFLSYYYSIFIMLRGNIPSGSIFDCCHRIDLIFYIFLKVKKDSIKIANYGLDRWLDLLDYMPEDELRQALKVYNFTR